MTWRQCLSVIVVLCLPTLAVNAQEQVVENQQNIHVGVLAIRGASDAQVRWQPTLDWLSERIPNVTFELYPYDLEGMVQAVEANTLDFVLTNPGQAVQLSRKYALSWLTTLTSGAPTYTNFGIGTALIVKKHSDYESIEDVAGLPIAAVAENAFGGYLTLRYEILQVGLNPNDFFADVRFLGFPIDATLYQLRDNIVEAAVVPACLLEKMAKEGLLEKEHYRAIHSQSSANFNCMVSTPLYPNWSFAKTPKGSEKLAKLMTQHLLAMPESSYPLQGINASGWTSPVSFLSVDQLYQAMDLHPLQRPWWRTALRWLGQHQEWAWGTIFLVLILNGYHFWLEYRFSKSKRALEQTLFRLKEKSELLEHAQRIAIVGELGTSVAHEMNQPLAAIRNYSEGASLRLAKNRPKEEIEPLLEKVHDQIDRAEAIIQRLRALIKKQSIIKVGCDVEKIVKDSVELLQSRIRNEQATVTVHISGEKRDIKGDAVGLQQVMINVLNNSLDACQSVHQSYVAHHYVSKIEVLVSYSATKVTIIIKDNGTGLKVDGPIEGFVTSKADGLGLGLTICRDVIEKHHGKLQISSASPHGCEVKVTLYDRE
ncbi:sensor histidine kinase [Vibrio mediterranei]|uniref:sensor histidine kinase n=1 Tax=Vibrio mediterranei TaxID=689 RepID=UPI004068742D